MNNSEYQQMYRRLNMERVKRTQLAAVKRLQREVYAAYGNKCECCGEDNLAFLTLDHVNNDGRKDRFPNGKRRCNVPIYRILKQEGWPKRVRLLCYNCNCGRHYNNGVCPHKKVVGMALKMLVGIMSCDVTPRKGQKQNHNGAVKKSIYEKDPLE